MLDSVRRRLRQAAILIVFTVGVVATAATSPAMTTINIAPASATFHLDREHPAALSRIVVRLGPEATSGHPSANVTLRIDLVRAVGDGGTGPDGSGAAGQVRFIVASATPGGGISAIATALPSVGPGPSLWQTEVQPASQVALPIDCRRAAGPCERGFWLVAELSGPESDAIDAGWHVGGSLMYSGNTWPSGANASVEIGDPIVLAAPVPQLAASTETETLTLGPTNPAAARVVEVSVGAAAIPEHGSRVGTLSVELVRRPGTGGSSDRPPLVQVYPVDELIAASPPPGAPLPSPAESDADPFAGCQPGSACARRFLVTIAWTGDSSEEEVFDWRLTVRRADLVRVWSTPADLSAHVVRGFDVASDSKPSTVHLEGDATAVAFDAPSQVQLALATRTTATDPLALLLPVPGVMTYRAQGLPLRPTASGGGPRVDTVITPRIPPSGTRSIYPPFVGTDVIGIASIFATPVGGCSIGEACPDLEIHTAVSPKDQGGPLPTVRFHWSLDLTVYSYADVPITLSAEDLSPQTADSTPPSL